jgi:nucleoside diphosphate kinase
MKNLNIYITEHINDPKKDEVFVIVKPGFLKKSAEIMEMIKEEGFELVKTTTKLLTLEEARDLYKIHKKEEWYKPLCDYMSSDLTLGLLFKSDDKDPLKKMAEVKDKVREKFGESDMRNVMHSSDSYEHMLDEQCIYFG